MDKDPKISERLEGYMRDPRMNVTKAMTRVRVEMINTIAREDYGSIHKFTNLTVRDLHLLLSEELGEIAEVLKIMAGLKPKGWSTEQCQEKLEEEVTQLASISLRWLNRMVEAREALNLVRERGPDGQGRAT